MGFYNPFGNAGNHSTAVAPAPPAAGSGSTSNVAGGGSAQPAAQAQAAMIPFYKAAKWHSEEGQTFSGQQFNTSFKASVPAFGWLSASVLAIQGTGGADTGETVAVSEDGPWNVITSLIVKNPTGLQLWSADGYAIYLVQRYMAQSLFAIESDSNSYSLDVGSDATGDFSIRVPLSQEFGQYGRGCLPNTNQAATYKVEAQFNTSAGFYTTPPDTLPTLSGSIGLRARLAPNATDIYGRAQMTQPPLNGIYQVISTQDAVVKNGHNTFFSTRVGNVIRYLLLVWRDDSNSRSGGVSDGTFPAADSHIRVTWDTTVLYDNTPAELNQLAFLKTGLVSPAGVIPLLFTDDEDHLATGEDGGQYIPTLGSTKLEIEWDSTASGGSFQLITVDIVSPDGGLGVTQ